MNPITRAMRQTLWGSHPHFESLGPQHHPAVILELSGASLLHLSPRGDHSPEEQYMQTEPQCKEGLVTVSLFPAPPEHCPHPGRAQASHPRQPTA